MEQLLPLKPGILAWLALVALVVSFAYRKLASKNTGLHLPPGPKPYPIIGNFFDLPGNDIPQFQHWLKHKDLYGPISSVTVMGNTVVILHDKEAVRYLLDKKSLKTSSRPHMEFAFTMCGIDNILPLAQPDEKYRWRRKVVNKQMGTKPVASQFNEVQEVEARRFMLRLLNDPKNLTKHIQTLGGAIILKTTYGYSIRPKKADPLVNLIERTTDNAAVAALPMVWMVDAIPALKYLPDWFPGTGFKKTAREWNKDLRDAAEIPYAFVKQQMENQTHRVSYVSKGLEQRNNGDEDFKGCDDVDDAIKWTAAAMYAAGAETTSATLTAFMLSMVMFPEAQRKAQEEIDRVIGTGRLPRVEDRENLPYVESLVKEIYRWSPATPISVPHRADEELICSGYRIPKGACLIPMVWWFLHDPEVYPNPESFEPERYMSPRNEPDPKTEAFGYGRRLCPGRYFADNTVFACVAQTLAVFNICRALDENGVEIEAKYEPSLALSLRPKEFPYRVVPRSAQAVELIRSVEVEHPWEEGDADRLEGISLE